MQEVFKELTAILDGEVETDHKTRAEFCSDASMYEIIPDAVLRPKHSQDVERLVACVTKHKSNHQSLGITPRGGGTDMSGGAIGGSLILDMTTYFTTIHPYNGDQLHAEPGVYMRDVDVILGADNIIGFAPSSHALCTVGGMVGNNSGGERSLRYGNAAQSVRELKVVFADGKEYIVKPLSKRELQLKMNQNDFEGNLYKKVYTLIENHYDTIKNARPRVNKNSMGYNLWSVWDRDTGIFDLTQLITGSQGTLGIITDVTVQTHTKLPYTATLIAHVNKSERLNTIIKTILRHNPASFEGFDDITFGLGIKHFTAFRRQLGTKQWLKQQIALLFDVARMHALTPNTFLVVEIDGATAEQAAQRITKLQHDLAKLKIKSTIENDNSADSLFWNMRKASIALLRERVHHKFAAPFIDDMIVQPRHIQAFLPEIRSIIRRYKLPATIAGHFGDGNFHIIPLIPIDRQSEQTILEPIMRELVPIVLKYGGTMAGEHNDGMVRGPWLSAVFGGVMYQHFRTVKEIFDPLYIFNPHKKTDASWEHSMEHIRKK